MLSEEAHQSTSSDEGALGVRRLGEGRVKGGRNLPRLAGDIGLADRAIVAEHEQGEKFDLEIGPCSLDPMRERWRRAWIERNEVGLFARFDRADAIVEAERPSVAQRYAIQASSAGQDWPLSCRTL